MRPFPPLLCFLAASIMTGCAALRHEAPRPERRPSGMAVAIREAPSHAPEVPSLSPVAEPDGDLTLRYALALALVHNPKLASSSLNVRIGEARTLQARLPPNPEIEFEIEEVAGSGGRRGFEATEMTIRLSQIVELGGKRSARARVADMESRLAAWDYEIERLAVLADVALGFIDVLVTQERLDLARDIVELSERILMTATERADAGKAPPLEKIRAGVELANSHIELQKVESELRSARKRLASTWGSSIPRFSRATGALDQLPEIPPFETVRAMLDRSPQVARWAQEMEHRLATLAMERARRAPDLTVSLGVQRFEETGEHALAFGVGLPLPFFDRNQGGVLEGRYRLEQLERERKNAETRAATALADSYEVMVSARAEAIKLKDEVLRAAGAALDAAWEGYRHGKSSYLEVLDAQRTVFEARARWLDALARHHRAAVVVESLIGARLDSLLDMGGKERQP